MSKRCARGIPSRSTLTSCSYSTRVASNRSTTVKPCSSNKRAVWLKKIPAPPAFAFVGWNSIVANSTQPRDFSLISVVTLCSSNLTACYLKPDRNAAAIVDLLDDGLLDVWIENNVARCLQPIFPNIADQGHLFLID